MVDFDGGVAVITGSAGGIGLGMARACLTRGMRVLLSDLADHRLDAAVVALSGQGASVIGHAADVRCRSQLEALRDRAMSEFGRIDLLCNNAGVGLTKPLVECTAADWDLLLDVNVKGVANGIAAFLPAMLEADRGHLNATASLSGLVSDPHLGIYSATKFAVVGMMGALARELTDTSVSASVLCPGPVDTGLLDSSAVHTGEAASAGAREYLSAGMAPEEVGELAIAGIADGRHWLFSHAALTRRIVENQVASMFDDGTLYVDPIDWTEQR
ncbi:MAG: SDR family NAD(P)-dependent oxidoreductase [bacterium]|nr:SDR family NAD(P)-dependent oxidoreductase [bacterium]